MPTTEVKRASLDELLEFANKVREAGGGNPLDALMPAVPEDVSQCLIAKNLNFNCTVGSVSIPIDHPIHDEDDEVSRWVMAVTDRDVRDRIAEALNLESFDAYDDGSTYGYDGDVKIEVYCVILPVEIGLVASDFDNWTDGWRYVIDNKTGDSRVAIVDENLGEFLPYVEASVREAYSIASVVNPDGSIVI